MALDTLSSHHSCMSKGDHLWPRGLLEGYPCLLITVEDLTNLSELYACLFKWNSCVVELLVVGAETIGAPLHRIRAVGRKPVLRRDLYF